MRLFSILSLFFEIGKGSESESNDMYENKQYGMD